MNFLSSEVAWCFYKSILQSCIEYCFHGWVGATSCYLNIGISCKKLECRTANHSFDILPHFQNKAALSLFCRYCFGRCSPELTEPFLLPYFGGGYTRYSNRLHDFPVTIPGCYKDVYGSSFFTRTARLWDSLSAECFPLTYYQNGFKGAMPSFPYFAGWFLGVWKLMLPNLKSLRQIIHFLVQ